MESLENDTQMKLAEREKNAKRILKSGNEKFKNEAEKMLENISLERDRRTAAKLNPSKEFEWDSSDRGHQVAYSKGKKVAEIKKDENHNSGNDEVYSVYINGQLFDTRYRYVADARKAVEKVILKTE